MIHPFERFAHPLFSINFSLLLFLSLAHSTPAQPSTTLKSSPDSPTSPTQGMVLVVPLHGEVENGLYVVLNRALNDAEKRNARAVVFDMHTPGGRVDSAIKIRDRLIRSPMKTYTYVNNMAISAGSFIALATDTIVMAPGSNIGGALPITLGPGGPSQVDEKFISVFASEMRKTAKHKGHPADIAEAFSNPDIVIPNLKPKGKILTLDYDQATSVGLAKFTSPSIESMLEREGLGKARIEHFKPTATDSVARFLSNPAIAGILLLVGLGGIFLEIKSPGLSLPGLVGVAAFTLYFLGSYLANLAGYMEIIFFVVGVILLLIEIFVIPGFGFVGVIGILCMFGAIFFALFNLAPAGFDFTIARIYTPVLTMLGGILGLLPALWLVGRLLPHTPVYGYLRLEPPKPKSNPLLEQGLELTTQPHLARGMQGVAVSDLRPSGIAMFNDRRTDVATEGEYIPRDEEIEIVRIEGNRVIVRRCATP